MRSVLLAAAAALLLPASRALAEPAAVAGPACPTDSLAPLSTPKVPLEVQPRAAGAAASYGGMQYRRTPGLGPRDIALTIDDGPNPQVTPLVLKVLAKHCLKVTYFLVGWYAHAYPDLVRQEAAAGHFIGTHTFSHPDNLRRLTAAQAEAEITDGFKAAQGALASGTPAEKARLAPFFRFPGLNDTAELSQWLAARRIAVVGADFGANDWMNISPQGIEHRALIEAAETHGGVHVGVVQDQDAAVRRGGFVEGVVLDGGRTDVLPVIRPEVGPDHGDVSPGDIVAELLGVGQPRKPEEGGKLGLLRRRAVGESAPGRLETFLDLFLGLRRAEPPDIVGMGVGVRPDEMPGVGLLSDQVRIGVGVPADQEIGGLQAVLGQDLQEDRCDLGAGSVIDGEGDVLGAEPGRPLVLHAAIGGGAAVGARHHLQLDLGRVQGRQRVGRAHWFGQR